jgi:hypothetical protein
MKKSILIIVILSIAALCFAGPLQEMHKRVIAGSTVAGGGVCGVDEDVLLYVDFEDNSSPYSFYKPSEETFTLSNAAINSDTTIVGNYTLDSPTAEDYAVVTIADIAGWSWTQFTIGFYVKVVGYTQWQRVFNAEYDGNNRMLFWLSGTSPGNVEATFYYVGDGNGPNMSTTTLDASQGDILFVEIHVDTTGPTYSIDVDGVELATSTTARGGLTAPTTLRIGQDEAGVNGDLSIDQFLYSTDPTESLYERRECTQF